MRIANTILKQTMSVSVIEYEEDPASLHGIEADTQLVGGAVHPGDDDLDWKPLPPSPPPTRLFLVTQKRNPQWADFRDFRVPVTHPWVLRCTVTSESPYFRFGVKLLSPDGRAFGDGAINSYDANLIVHIGRNNWDRPKLGITAQDIFFTAYMSGNLIEDDDRYVFRAEPTASVPFELLVDQSYVVKVTVNGVLCLERVVPPALCRRLVLYAWGDREEFEVKVHDLAIQRVQKRR